MAKRFHKNQIEALMSAFEESDHLTKQKKIELGNTTGLDVEQIASWFNRKRAHKRARESVVDLEQTNAELQQNLRESKKRETKLRLDIEQSKRRQTEIGAENQRLRQKLGMIGVADSEFDTILRSTNQSMILISWAGAGSVTQFAIADSDIKDRDNAFGFAKA